MKLAFATYPICRAEWGQCTLTAKATCIVKWSKATGLRCKWYHPSRHMVTDGEAEDNHRSIEEG